QPKSTQPSRPGDEKRRSEDVRNQTHPADSPALCNTPARLASGVGNRASNTPKVREVSKPVISDQTPTRRIRSSHNKKSPPLPTRSTKLRKCADAQIRAHANPHDSRNIIRSARERSQAHPLK